MYNCALVLAAGEGKRMKSETPKVLHKVCGKEMVNHVIDTLRASEVSDIAVVVGKGADKVKEGTKNRNVSYCLQENQLGTGHAVMCAEDFLKGKKGNVLIFVGDGPLITKETVSELINEYGTDFDATILTTILEEPLKYGRIVKDESGNVLKIVEFKDCSTEEEKIKEVNSGMYLFNIEKLLECLKEINNNNAQKEYYLTDVIAIMKKKGYKVGAFSVPNEETLAANSRVELATLEKIMRNRINNFHMENGVTIIDPDNTYIGTDVVIEKDVTIYPGNVLEGKTVIKEGAVLYPNSRIKDSVIGKNVTVQCSVVLESSVGENTTVGPYAYIRPETTIGEGARIGDFVEIKKSTIGDGTKVSHLTYIGDAEVGSHCNFGCGTVVVNYDGVHKYKTIIGHNSFIGCNTNLVSPVVVGDDTFIAAGSTITDEIPKGAFAIARARQINKEDWVYKRKLKKKD